MKVFRCQKNKKNTIGGCNNKKYIGFECILEHGGIRLLMPRPDQITPLKKMLEKEKDG